MTKPRRSGTTSTTSIPQSEAAWDERLLGADEEYAELVDEETEKAIDEAACTRLISIRLQNALIEDLKLIAALNGGTGYQTLMKQVLQRFVDCEKKALFRKLASEKISEQAPESHPEKPRKLA